MAREPCFTAELFAVRKALGNGAGNFADRAHLRRWEQDSRAQEIWDEWHEHAAILPREFIACNLGFRRYAEALPSHIADAKNWRKGWRDYFARSADEIFDGRPLSNARALLEALHREADSALYARHVRWSRVPLHISRQNKTRKHDKTQSIDAQGEDNWRTRKLFMIEVGTLWDPQGHWNDGVVAALTEIAIPGAEIEAHQVRNVRRSLVNSHPKNTA